MRRRAFIAGLGGAAAWPVVARAQQQTGQSLAAGPLVGFLNSASPDTYRFNADSFREGLAKAGFVEGQNLRIEERWAHGDYRHYRRLRLNLWPRVWLLLPPPGMSLLHAPRSARATRCLWSLRLAATRSALDWSKV